MCLGIALIGLLVGQRPPTLSELYEQKRYFELRDTIRTAPEASTNFYRSVVAAKFNRPEDAIEFGRAYVASGTPDHRRDALELIANSNFKVFRYAEAAHQISDLLKEFGEVMSESDRADLVNFQNICLAVQDVPPQQVTKSGDSQFKNEEKEGIRLPVSFGGEYVPLLFDTGANISVLRSGVAQQMGVRLLEREIKVGTMTGNSVTAQMGWLPEIRIGKAIVRNPIFLVLSDKDLTIAPDFMLDGLIGFPIISALGELTVHKNGIVEVPAAAKRVGPQNLCLEGLQPLVEVSHRGERLTMAFDTGANTTVLYRPFFRRFEKQVTGAGKPVKHRLTGVGSSTTVDAFLMPSVELELGGSQVLLKGVEVLPAEKDSASRHFYGNLGQDALGGFESWTMNFERMSLTLR